MTIANPTRPTPLYRIYRALQFVAFILPALATALTAYGVGALHARETNPFFSLLFAQRWPDFALATLLRLALTVSLVAQSSSLWRLGQRDRRLRALGWAILIVWIALTAVDASHDAWVVFR